MLSIRSRLTRWLVLPAALQATQGTAFGQTTGALPAEPTAKAETGSRARLLFQKGERHYNMGEYDEAIRLFKEAYELSGAPLILYNIGQAYRLKGDCRPALESYRHFLRLDPQSDWASAVKDHVRELEASCREAASPSSNSKPPAIVQQAPSGSPPPSPASSPPTSDRLPGTDRHQGRQETALVLLVVGLALGSAAGVMAVWNSNRFNHWIEQDSRLARANDGGSRWIGLQTANDDLLRSIHRYDSIDLGLAIAAGASLTGAVLTYFVFGQKPPGSDRPINATAVPRSEEMSHAFPCF